MKRSILSGIFVFVLLSGTALASPLADYSAGKTAIDLTLHASGNVKSEFSGDDGDDQLTVPGKKAGDFAATIGLGNRMALQYGAYAPRAPFWGVATQQFNLLYQVDKGISVFAGVLNAKYSTSDSRAQPEKKNIFQGGLIGYTPLGRDTVLYGTVGFGRDLTDREVGVSYAFTKNLEFNLSYRWLTVRNLNITYEDSGAVWHDTSTITAPGLGMGVTLKF
ncbi:MAG: hypothetical protein P4N41_05415 [Negativicutes bacterium]|nr:hypothetical protein [Negativicutes bacterium]